MYSHVVIMTSAPPPSSLYRLIVHFSGEGLLHSLGLLLVLGGVAVLLTMQLPEASNLYPHW